MSNLADSKEERQISNFPQQVQPSVEIEPDLDEGDAIDTLDLTAEMDEESVELNDELVSQEDIFTCLQSHLEQTQINMTHCANLTNRMVEERNAEIAHGKRQAHLDHERIEHLEQQLQSATQKIRGLEASYRSGKKATQTARDRAVVLQKVLDRRNEELKSANNKLEVVERLSGPSKARLLDLIKLGRRLDDGIIKRVARLSQLHMKMEIEGRENEDDYYSPLGKKATRKEVENNLFMMGPAWRRIEVEYKRVTNNGEFKFGDFDVEVLDKTNSSSNQG